MEPPSVVLSAEQTRALTRAQALAAELAELVAALRAPPADVAAAPSLEPPEPDETLAAGELRAAFAASSAAPRRRPRWAGDLLT